jgi:hypothetical protein
MCDEFTDAHGVWRVAEVLPNGAKRYVLAEPVVKEKKSKGKVKKNASTKKGNRPSYIKAAKPDVAIPLYEQMIGALEQELGKEIGTGEFGADMKVSLINDGPVTIVIDSKNRV